MNAAAVLLSAALFAAAAPAAPARFVVVVGNNGSGGQGRAVLKHADDDAARFYLSTLPAAKRAWLLTTFDRESARAFDALTDVARPPSRRELARVLGEVAWEMRATKEAGEETELLFYFAGHGDVDAGGEGYLVFSDGPFTRDDLRTHVIRGSIADTNHIVLDACASYFMVARGDKTQSGKRVLSPAQLDALKSGGDHDEDLRTGVFVSTSDAAEVHESPRVGGGVFSYLLRSALAGGADVNGDGKVEYGEAAAFIKAAGNTIEDPRARLNVYAHAPRQRPHATLSTLPAISDRFLDLDIAKGKHVQLLDARGVPYAEVNTAPGQDVKIALVGNPYYVVRVGNKEALLVPRRAGAYAISALEFDDAISSRSATGSFGGLFARPFDRAFLDGFLAASDLLPPRQGERFAPLYAKGGEAKWRFPWIGAGTTSLVAAGAFAAVAAGASVGNAISYVQAQRELEQTRAISPSRARTVDAWGAAAQASLVGATLLGLSGSAMIAWGILQDEEDL